MTPKNMTKVTQNDTKTTKNDTKLPFTIHHIHHNFPQFSTIYVRGETMSGNNLFSCSLNFALSSRPAPLANAALMLS